MSRFARRKDVNHKSITDELEQHGIQVFDVSSVPSLGFDIVCHYKNWWQPFELKSSKTVHHKSEVTKLRPSQHEAAARAFIPTVESAQEILLYFGVIE